MSDRDPVLNALFLLSFAGLVASCAVHLAALLGFAPPLTLSTVWVLHLAGALLIFAALLAAWKSTGTFEPRSLIAHAFGHAPGFYRVSLWILVGYAGVAGLLILLAGSGGANYLFGRGEAATGFRPAGQSNGAEISYFRLLTCGWIAGYAIATALLASAKNASAQKP